MPLVDDIIWDAKAEEHVGKHGLDYDDVLHAVNNAVSVMQGRDERLLYFGRSVSGQWVVIAMEETDTEGKWYPVMGRPASRKERDKYIEPRLEEERYEERAPRQEDEPR